MDSHMIAHDGVGGDDADPGRGTHVSDKTIRRLRAYLYALDELSKEGKTVVSSQAIAERVNVKSGLVRKDLSHFGGFGRPSQGYNIAYLRNKIAEILRADQTRNVAWAGAQKLAQNPQLIERFALHNCRLVAVLDGDPGMIGQCVFGVEVTDVKDAEQAARDLAIEAIVVAVSANDAQSVIDAVVAGGCKAILNMNEAVLSAPPGVVLRNMDVAGELVLLCREAENSLADA